MSEEAKNKNIDFAGSMKELETIATWFESGNSDLETGLAKFEEGMKLISDLKQYLASVENKVEKIKLKFDSKE